ncbi:hypothetical protein ACQUSR_19095 [Streptomyces sp. P1-3]
MVDRPVLTRDLHGHQYQRLGQSAEEIPEDGRQFALLADQADLLEFAQ